MSNMYSREEERKEKIEIFYRLNPDKIACCECAQEISEEQMELSSQHSGLILCGICLTILAASARQYEKGKMKPLYEYEEDIFQSGEIP